MLKNNVEKENNKPTLLSIPLKNSEQHSQQIISANRKYTSYIDTNKHFNNQWKTKTFRI